MLDRLLTWEFSINWEKSDPTRGKPHFKGDSRGGERESTHSLVWWFLDGVCDGRLCHKNTHFFGVTQVTTRHFIPFIWFVVRDEKLRSSRLRPKFVRGRQPFPFDQPWVMNCRECKDQKTSKRIRLSGEIYVKTRPLSEKQTQWNEKHDFSGH